MARRQELKEGSHTVEELKAKQAAFPAPMSRECLVLRPGAQKVGWQKKKNQKLDGNQSPVCFFFFLLFFFLFKQLLFCFGLFGAAGGGLGTR